MKALTIKLNLAFWVVALCFSGSVEAQQKPINRAKAYADALNALRQLKPIEKLYLQTDKPNYVAGDTLRFKAYLLNADYLTPSANSGLLYVELYNSKGKKTKRVMVEISSGLSWGEMPLDTTDVPDGSYTLRAYTNWMRNFGEDYIFEKQVTITKTDDSPMLVKANFKPVGAKIEGDLFFSLMDGRVMGFKDMELKVMNGSKNLSKDKVTTASEGYVKINFNMPKETGGLSILASTTGQGALNIPVLINRRDNTDLQFMPEGGNLVAGLPAIVGFKAIGEDGKGIAVKGTIVNNKGNTVASFSSAHAGMGSFEFTPLAGEVYIAKVEGIAKTYPLPLIKLSGTSLAVKQAGTDSLQVAVTATPDAESNYYLIAHSRGVACYAQTVRSSLSKIVIAKNLFPTGIVRFSLINGINQVVNERIAFINRHDDLRIAIQPHQLSYGIRDSIALTIKVTNSDGKPVEGSFSLAVTDGSQVKTDSLGTNIINNLLFTSDLKGYVEEPDYYFKGNKETDLDNLMLTQGWVGYNWQEVFRPKPPYPFKPEQQFNVTGKVVNAFGKPVEKSQIVLASNHPTIVKDTLTDANGRFVFKDLFPVDTGLFKLQARNKNNKEYNVRIIVDETEPPAFSQTAAIKPWYVDTDSILLNSSRNKIAEAKAWSNFRGEGHALKEVNIRAKKSIRGSKNLNGPGEADYIIDEDEIKSKPAIITLEQMLIDKLPQFKPTGGNWSYRIVGYGMTTVPLYPYVLGTKKIRLFIDGIPIDRYFLTTQLMAKVPRYDNIKQMLTYFTGEDVKGIEVMENVKYLNRYHGSIEGGNTEYANISADSYAYIEITTRTGHGPWMKATPGTFLYKPTPFSLAHQFYSPKYTVKNKGTALGTDLRSTIYWEPNVITDKDGKATVSFYSADKAANYNVVIEGADLEGSLGIGKQQIKVK